MLRNHSQFYIFGLNNLCDGTQKDWENILSKIRPEVDKAISDFCKEILPENSSIVRLQSVLVEFDNWKIKHKKSPR